MLQSVFIKTLFMKTETLNKRNTLGGKTTLPVYGILIVDKKKPVNPRKLQETIVTLYLSFQFENRKLSFCNYLIGSKQDKHSLRYF